MNIACCLLAAVTAVSMSCGLPLSLSSAGPGSAPPAAESVNTEPALLRAAACLGQARSALELQCPARHMLRVITVRYGNSGSACDLGPTDCQFDVPEPDVITACTGQPSCSLDLPRDPPALPHCSRVANVYAIDYLCVAESSVHDICAESELFELSGYIRTPRYPVNYPPNQRCSLHIRVPNTHGLRLIVIDMNVAKGVTSDCDDYLYAGDGLRTVSICSVQVLHELLHTDSSHIQVQFQSNAAKAQKGFFLYYQAFRKHDESSTRPPRTSSSSSTTSNSVLFRHGPSTRHPAGSTTGSTSPTSGHVQMTPPAGDTEQDELPVGAIIGGLLGSLSALLLALLTLLLLRRCQAPRTPKRCQAGPPGAGPPGATPGTATALAPSRAGSQLLAAGARYLDNLRCSDSGRVIVARSECALSGHCEPCNTQKLTVDARFPLDELEPWQKAV